jgi:hypothetical protein|tara:strand:- start:331 stop:1512 length:1182 start_codon:yes stop_codon:yes gene_type:complete
MNSNKPNKLSYIGVFILVYVLFIFVSAIYSEFFDYFILRQLNTNNISNGFYLFFAGACVIECIITISVYSAFSKLNLKRVLPYYWIIGIIQLFLGSLMIVGQYGEILSSDDTIKLLATVIFSKLIGIIAVHSTFVKIQNKRDSSKLSIEKPSDLSTYEQNVPLNYEKEIVQASIISEELPYQPEENLPEQAIELDNWAGFAKAQTVIDYNPKAAAAWKAFEEFPEKLKLKFIETLEHDPKTDIAKLKSKITREYKKITKPFDSVELNAAYAKALNYSKFSAEEFIRVHNILGDTVTPNNLLKKVLAKAKGLKITTEQLEALEYALNTNYFNEVLDCLIKLNYILDPLNPEKISGMHNYSDYNITTRENITVKVKNSGILHFANSELKKLKQEI